MTDIASLREAVVELLRQKIPGVDVEPHGGTFDQAELARFATKAPAIRVAIVGFGRIERYNDGRIALPAHLAAVTVAKDAMVAGKKIARDVAGLGLAGAVSIAIQGQRFALSGVMQPEDLVAKSEYSGALDQTGVSLWQVTWTTKILLGDQIDDAIAALSDLWINGVAMSSGDEILPQFPTQPPIGDLPVEFPADPSQRFGAPPRDLTEA